MLRRQFKEIQLSVMKFLLRCMSTPLCYLPFLPRGTTFMIASLSLEDEEMGVNSGRKDKGAKIIMVELLPLKISIHHSSNFSQFGTDFYSLKDFFFKITNEDRLLVRWSRYVIVYM